MFLFGIMCQSICVRFFLPISKVVKVALYKLEHGIFVEQMANLYNVETSVI